MRGLKFATTCWLVCFGITAFAGGGDKKTGETCATDGDCARGHCYTKQSDSTKVCVDCSSSDISDYRGRISTYCKTEPRGCTSIPQGDETSEDFFKVRIENGSKCIAARDGENRACWNGADDGHKQALEEAERARTNCYNEWNTRKGDGRIYTCSDSDYTSKNSNAQYYCTRYATCNDYAKDDKAIDCSRLTNVITDATKCTSSVEDLDSHCLPRLTRARENQFGDAKKVIDNCKAILDYKQEKKLCN